MFRILSVLTLALWLSSSCTTSKSIFQERSNDWNEFGDANWNFSNNELFGSISEGAGFVMTNKTYKNFLLVLEFIPDSTINSGIFVRCQNKEITPTDCYEINIWDLHPNQESRTGAIVTRTVPLAHVETLNKWNTYKIKSEENHIQVWVNGVLTADYMDDSLMSGYIALQASGKGKIGFRNVKLTEL